MLNKQIMNHPTNLYYLYCMNVQCQLSIYHRMVERRVPFTAENLVKTHICSCCKDEMISAMDIEIKKVMAEAISRRVSRKDFLNN
jgi:hypothetical protein